MPYFGILKRFRRAWWEAEAGRSKVQAPPWQTCNPMPKGGWGMGIVQCGCSGFNLQQENETKPTKQMSYPPSDILNQIYTLISGGNFYF